MGMKKLDADVMRELLLQNPEFSAMLEKAVGQYFAEVNIAEIEADERIIDHITESTKPKDAGYLEAYEEHFLDHLVSLKSCIDGTPKDSPERRKYADEILNTLKREKNMSEKIKKDYEQLLGDVLTYNDSGKNIVNADPAMKALVSRKYGEVFYGTNPENKERAVLQLIEGYITPYEKELLECVAKFKWDGQITEKGKIWFTLGQLYRSMRHGAGTVSPQKQQKAELLKALNELEKVERKLEFQLNGSLTAWGGFEATGGKFRIISFDELYGKINGQDDILIVTDDTPVINLISENVGMYEVISQEVKGIMQSCYQMTLKKPLEIKKEVKNKETGEKETKITKVTKRSFKTLKEKQAFLEKHGLTDADVEGCVLDKKPFTLNESRIAVRAVILDFVYRYIRARGAKQPKHYSNMLPYKVIFERCGVDTGSREIVKLTKYNISVILDHLVSCESLPELVGWREYANKHSKKADGIEIFVEFAEEDQQEQLSLFEK